MVNIPLKNKQNDQYMSALSITFKGSPFASSNGCISSLSPSGATGELCLTPNGLSVDYQSIGPLADDHCYKPDGMLAASCSRVLCSPLIYTSIMLKAIH